MKRLLIVCCLGVAACGGPQVTGNMAGGIVSHLGAFNQDDALARADAHCKQFNKIARVTGQSALNSNFTFDCVSAQ